METGEHVHWEALGRTSVREWGEQKRFPESPQANSGSSRVGVVLQNGPKLKLEDWLWFTSLTRRGHNFSWGSSVECKIPRVGGIKSGSSAANLKAAEGMSFSSRRSDLWSKTSSSTFLSIYRVNGIFYNEKLHKETCFWNYSEMLFIVLNMS